jgi:tubulin polyglutamylase TTLL6/13
MILEVNYTPSFTTDTPLDTLIKESLIRDTLDLMNITNKVKNDALNLKKR